MRSTMKFAWLSGRPLWWLAIVLGGIFFWLVPEDVYQPYFNSAAPFLLLAALAWAVYLLADNRALRRLARQQAQSPAPVSAQPLAADRLTGLPDRYHFLEKLQACLVEQGRAPSHSASLGALLFIDLDHFKLLNDVHGHAAGDALLRLIATRLQQFSHAANLAARLGGDEFVLMLTELGSDRDVAQGVALRIAHQVRDAILAPYSLNLPGARPGESRNLRYTCSGSIGLALFGGASEPLADVLKRADMAMYQAKQAGRNAVRQFDPVTQSQLDQRTALIGALNLGISSPQFQVHYQVQVDHANVALGAECLLRWNHPQLGPIAPALFIPLAEECGAIAVIGEWVLREACQTLARWKQMPHMAGLSLSVNVSPKQLMGADFVTRLAQLLHTHGVAPAHLILELTEGSVLQNVDEVIGTMHRIRNLGVRLSIDDFGTGYSSLSYLQRLPVNEIKIDRSFVHAMSKQEESSTIVGAIIALAEKLKFTVVAEGVETTEQRARLMEMGVSTVQGYLIARPVQLADLEAFVAALHD